LSVFALSGLAAGSACSMEPLDPSEAPAVETAVNIDSHPARAPSFATIFKAPLGIEGLTADTAGNLYSAGRGGNNPCPVWRVAAADSAVAIVGTLAPPCSPSGLAFDAAGALYIADGSDKIFRLVPNAKAPPTAALFASGVPGGNGIAFDRNGNLWATDGAVGLGRVVKIARDGTVTEVFRVQPMANDVNATVVGAMTVGGVGRDVHPLPPGTVNLGPNPGRAGLDAVGSVSIVANGIAFDRDGDTAFIADTARGAIWRIQLDRRGNLRSSVGCDTTFLPNTLCLENLFVQHPILDGLDGIALDVEGNIWGAANERNAVVEVTRDGAVREVFRNAPDPTTRLRNAGPLEFPTSPFLAGRRLCVSQTDALRRDNAPNAAGEIGGTTGFLGKLSCMEQPLAAAGLRLPIR
jgi:sugar lactone lactonase YvrE